MAEIEESSEPAADVDWAYIEEELRDVPDEYKEQTRFYPLKHVVEIFSSGDPQYLTAEVSMEAGLRGQCARAMVHCLPDAFSSAQRGHSTAAARGHALREPDGVMFVPCCHTAA